MLERHDLPKERVRLSRNGRVSFEHRRLDVVDLFLECLRDWTILVDDLVHDRVEDRLGPEHQ